MEKRQENDKTPVFILGENIRQRTETLLAMAYNFIINKTYDYYIFLLPCLSFKENRYYFWLIDFVNNRNNIMMVEKGDECFLEHIKTCLGLVPNDSKKIVTDKSLCIIIDEFDKCGIIPDVHALLGEIYLAELKEPVLEEKSTPILEKFRDGKIKVCISTDVSISKI